MLTGGKPGSCSPLHSGAAALCLVLWAAHKSGEVGIYYPTYYPASPSVIVQLRGITSDNLLVASVYIVVCSQILVGIDALNANLAKGLETAVEAEPPLGAKLKCEKDKITWAR